MDTKNQKTALVTGAAGFIGYHMSKRLLDEGWRVVGLDSMSDYYDVSLKEKRESMLLHYPSYLSLHEKVETPNVLMDLFEKERPEIVIHLAAQAGVRYSLKNPRSYLESNINGTFELLEAARAYPPEHMLLASTSSAYGANEKMPYKETVKADHQVSFYAATKKSSENIAHCYSHLFDIPITVFRFFTVYGPWGRPDMAPHLFARAIINGEKISVFNYGEMERDFTYINDLVTAIFLLIENKPQLKSIILKPFEDSLSPVAPWRVINIGNSKPVKLGDFIRTIENKLNKKAKWNKLPMQAGDVKSTWADVSLLRNLTGYQPDTDLNDGICQFLAWFREYYN